MNLEIEIQRFRFNSQKMHEVETLRGKLNGGPQIKIAKHQRPTKRRLPFGTTPGVGSPNSKNRF